jgi:hypothetical protein
VELSVTDCIVMAVADDYSKTTSHGSNARY